MKAIKKLGQGVLVAIGVLGLAGAASAAPKAITTCKTITESGPYVVTRNLTATGDCLTVMVPHVTIDLGGYVLTGNGTKSGIRNWSSFGHTVVRNGVITGFHDGISLGGPNNVVEEVRVYDMTDYGVYVGPGSVVRDSIVNNNNSFGIWLECPGTAIGNTAVNNFFEGIVTEGAGCVLAHNNATVF